jgi:hypothetical protein
MDQAIINNLERAIVTDPQRMQDLGVRGLAELTRWLTARRVNDVAGSAGTAGTATGITEVPDSVCAGLGLTIAGGGTQVALNPGWLAQYSATYPDTTPAYQSSERLGLNMTTANWTITGAVANAVVLVEARVVDNVTLQSTVDVFDPVTQTFSPQLLDKVEERQIELNFVVGSLGTFPVWSGGTWVPLWMILLDASALWQGSVVYDLRRLPEDVIPQVITQSSTAVLSPAHAVIESQQLRTAYSPGSTPTAAIAGRVRARCRDMVLEYSSVGQGGFADGAAPGIDPGLTPVAGTLENLYLCSITANGLTRAPRLSNLATQGPNAGVLVRSNAAVARDGVTNGAAVGLPGTLSGYTCPAGTAVAVGAVSPATGAPTTRLTWFNQDSAGNCVVQMAAAPYDLGLITASALPVAAYTSVGTVVPSVPTQARTIKLWVQIQIAGGLASVSLHPTSGSATADSASITTTDGYVAFEVEIPAVFESAVGVPSWTWSVQVTSGTVDVAIRTKVKGWTV